MTPADRSRRALLRRLMGLPLAGALACLNAGAVRRTPTVTAETRAGVAAWNGPGSLVLVTHQVNITALTGIFPASGEVIVLQPRPERPEGFVVVGRVVVR